MKKIILIASILSIIGCKESGGGGSASNPSTPGEEAPCLDCGDTQGKQTYSGYYVAQDDWTQEVNINVADMTSGGLVQAPNEFFHTQAVGDSFTQVYGVNNPFCGDGLSRDAMYIWFNDEYDSGSFKIVHLQTNNQVHIYEYNPNFTMAGSTATLDSELNTAWNCDGGILKRLEETGNPEYLAANESYGYMLYNTYSGPLFEISLSAVPSDLTSLNSFKVFFDNGEYKTTTDFVYVNSGGVNPTQYDTTGSANDVNTTDMYNAFLGTGGSLGYIYRAGETFTHRSSFIVIKGLQDKDLNTKNLLMGIFRQAGIVEGSSSAAVYFGMTP